MANPGMMAEVLQSNPAARAIMEANPRLHQLMTSPNALQGILQGAPPNLLVHLHPTR